MKRRLLVLAAALLVVPAARADMGPFIPVAKHAETTMTRIEIVDALPEHIGVFVRTYGPPEPSSASEFISLMPGTILEFSGRYQDWAELVIVPRAAAEPYPSANALVDAARAGEVPSVSRSFYSRETLPSWGPNDIALDYRVQLKARVPAIVRTSPDPLRQWYVAALALTSAVVLGGLWLVRLIFRRLRGPDSVKGTELPPLPPVQP